MCGGKGKHAQRNNDRPEHGKRKCNAYDELLERRVHSGEPLDEFAYGVNEVCDNRNEGNKRLCHPVAEPLPRLLNPARVRREVLRELLEHLLGDSAIILELIDDLVVVSSLVTELAQEDLHAANLVTTGDHSRRLSTLSVAKLIVATRQVEELLLHRESVELLHGDHAVAELLVHVLDNSSRVTRLTLDASHNHTETVTGLLCGTSRWGDGSEHSGKVGGTHAGRACDRRGALEACREVLNVQCSLVARVVKLRENLCQTLS